MAVGTGGVGAVAGGGYMVVDGASNVMGGTSKIINGLKGRDSSNGGGDDWNFVKNGYMAVAPKDGLLSGENIYNATQLGIGAKAIASGITELPNKMEKD